MEMMNSRFLVAVLILFVLVWNVHGQRRKDLERRPRQYQDGGRRGGGPRIKRMYALCPPQFERVGNECYYFSDAKVNWLDAQFQCQDRNSKLAEPSKVDDRRLRKHLLAAPAARRDLWLGGTYDWSNHIWNWGYNGKKMTYKAFLKPKELSKHTDLRHHCTVMSKEIKYRWQAVPCMEDHYFVCQHKMPVVKKNSLQHIYNMWNHTFPNQIANEIEVIFTNKETGDLTQRYQIQSDVLDRPQNRRNNRHRQRNAPQPGNEAGKVRKHSSAGRNALNEEEVEAKVQSRVHRLKSRLGQLARVSDEDKVADRQKLKEKYRERFNY